MSKKETESCNSISQRSLEVIYDYNNGSSTRLYTMDYEKYKKFKSMQVWVTCKVKEAGKGQEMSF